MDKTTIANAIFTRAYEMKDYDLTTEDCDELAEAVIAAARRETPEDWEELLLKATRAIDYLRESKTTRYEAAMYAQAALEAAGVLELTDRAEQKADNLQRIFDALELGDCPSDAFDEMDESDRVISICESITELRRFLTHWHDQSNRFFTELAEIREAYARVLAEQCAPDEKHCTCVPALRARIAELEAHEEKVNVFAENCQHVVDTMKARIAELEVELVKVREVAHENFTYLEGQAQARMESR